MITLRLSIFLYIAITCFFVFIFFLIKKKLLTLKYSLIWLFGGVIVLLIILFPGTFSSLMEKLGLITPSNGLFAICIFVFMIVTLLLTSVISSMYAKIKRLIQSIGIIEKRIRELEGKESTK